MSIYKYTLRKFIKSPSTWVILAISAAVMFIIPWLTYNVMPDNISSSAYSAMTAAVYAGVVSLVIFFGAIFTGFKGAQVYKDEVEDGTFLIVLSKPQSRSKIIFYKWLALSTMCVLFLIVILIALIIAIVSFGRAPIITSSGENISIYHNLPKAISILFALGLVLIMILSSIALIVSTKVSTGGTIGIVVAIGVAVPITAIIGQVSGTTKYSTSFLVGTTRGKTNALLNDLNDELVADSKPEIDPDSKNWEVTTQLIDLIYASAISNQDMNLKDMGIPPIPGLPSTLPGAGLGFIGVNVDTSASFNYLSFIDLNYQAARLSSIATDVTSTSNTQADGAAIAAASGGGGPGNIKKQKFVSSYTSASFKEKGGVEYNINQLITDGNTVLQNIYKTLFKIDIPLAKTGLYLDWTYFVDYSALKDAGTIADKKIDIPNTQDASANIQKYFANLADGKKLDKIEYVDFLNKYAILVTYIIIAAVLVPASYFILRKQDFR